MKVSELWQKFGQMGIHLRAEAESNVWPNLSAKVRHQPNFGPSLISLSTGTSPVVKCRVCKLSITCCGHYRKMDGIKKLIT